MQSTEELEDQISGLEDDLSTARERIEELEQEISAKDNKITEARSALDDLAHRVRDALADLKA